MAVFPPNVYPPVDHFSEEALDHLVRHLSESTIPAAVARLAGVLWIRHHRLEYADRAIAAYLEAVATDLDTDLGLTTTLDYLQRALDLVRALGRDDDPAAEVVFQLIDRLVARGHWGLVCASVRLVHKTLALRGHRARGY